MPRYSLRVRNNDFSTLEQLEKGITAVHAQGKQFFLASNLLPHNSKVKTFLDDMAPIIALKPDALIMADPGLIMLVRVGMYRSVSVQVQVGVRNIANRLHDAPYEVGDPKADQHPCRPVTSQ